MYNRSALNLSMVLLACVVTSCGGSSTHIDIAPVAGIEMGAAMGAVSTPYSVQLTGSQVLPVVNTRHTGQADFGVAEQSGQLFGTVTSSIETATEVHLHEGSANQVGVVLIDLIPAASTTDNNRFSVPAGFVLTPQQRVLYDSGELYVDIHAPDIELRGQLSTEQPLQSISASLDDLQAKLFTPVCSGCHFGGGSTLPTIMNLTTADATYRSLVGVFSVGEADLLRVAVGDADNSLLLKKIEGTQNVGARMPFRGAKLDAETIAAVKQWVNMGAKQ